MQQLTHPYVGLVPFRPPRSAASRTLRKSLIGRGHRKAIRWMLATLLMLASCRSGAACADVERTPPVSLSITRYFSEVEDQTRPGVVGIQGNGWFASSSLMLTASHVADAMHLSTTEWKQIELRDGQTSRSVAVPAACWQSIGENSRA